VSIAGEFRGQDAGAAAEVEDLSLGQTTVLEDSAKELEVAGGELTPVEVVDPAEALVNLESHDFDSFS